MKKLFALILSLCLLCGCTALADNDVTWEQVSALVEDAGITGNWYTFDDIAAAIYIPDGLVNSELRSIFRRKARSCSAASRATSSLPRKTVLLWRFSM